MPTQQDWTKEEVKLIVNDYFEMLQDELNGRPYNKTKHRQKLLNILKRTEGSIEFKHQNISAALINMGLPYINGYKPRFRYQKEVLEREISKHITKHRLQLENMFSSFADSEIIQNRYDINFDHILVEAPEPKRKLEPEPKFRPVKTNYLEREQNNRALGEEGEEFVIDFERWRLIKQGKEHYVNDIKWVSKEMGDGLGFDILSKNVDGTDRYIEVKTTKLSIDTPIFVSKTEVNFADKETQRFFLYRVFCFASTPQLFIKHGSYADFCTLTPASFKAYF